MNRRSFFSFLAVAPVAIALPSAAPRSFKEALYRFLRTLSPSELDRMWDGKAYLSLEDARSQDLIDLATKWKPKSILVHWK